MKTTLAVLATGSLLVIAFVTVKNYVDEREAERLAEEDIRKARIEWEEDWKRMEAEQGERQRRMMEQTIEATKETDAMLERLSGKVRVR